MIILERWIPRNEWRRHNRFLWVVTVSCLGLAPAFGAADLNGKIHEFHYSDHYRLRSERGSSVCSESCAYLVGIGGEAIPRIPFLGKIAFPGTRSKNKYLIGQEYQKTKWVIFDLKAEKVIFSSEEKSTVLEKWLDLGFGPPDFIEAFALSTRFEETAASIEENYQSYWVSLSIGLVLVLGLSALLFFPIRFAIGNLAKKWPKRV